MYAVGLLIVANLAGVWLAGLMDRWGLFEKGWPMELLLVSVVLCAIMFTASSIWMLIPAGILLGNGVLFSYYSLTGNWRHWIFLWPLEPLLVIGTVWLTTRLAGHGERSGRVGRRLGVVLGLVAISWSIIVGLLAMVVTLLQPV